MLALSRPCGVSSSCPRRAALPRRALRCVAMSTNAAGSATAQPRVPKVIVVGAGRVGAALERMGDGQDVARALRPRRTPMQSVMNRCAAPRPVAAQPAAQAAPARSRRAALPQVMRRGDAFPKSMPPGTPILGATRNDALAGVVDSTPADRRRDLVFMQNGMLQPWQEERGLGDATQARAALAEFATHACV